MKTTADMTLTTRRLTLQACRRCDEVDPQEPGHDAVDGDGGREGDAGEGPVGPGAALEQHRQHRGAGPPGAEPQRGVLEAERVGGLRGRQELCLHAGRQMQKLNGINQ